MQEWAFKELFLITVVNCEILNNGFIIVAILRYTKTPEYGKITLYVHFEKILLITVYTLVVDITSIITTEF